MRKQIKKLSPHQNGKVFGILMAVSSLVFLLPMFLITLGIPEIDAEGNVSQFPKFMFLIMPLFYLAFGYIFTAIGCLVYNLFVPHIGGFEFDLEDKNS